MTSVLQFKSIKLPLVIIALVVLALGLALLWPTFTDHGEQVYCTMEAKLCPDGSYVGRTGPKCEFTPCPGQ